MIELDIDKKTCTRCGRCVAVCTARILTQEKRKGDIGTVNPQTCIECGQCVAICPTDSIEHSSFIGNKNIHKVKKDLIPSPRALLELMRKRRSNRTFSQREVPMKHLDMILEAANLAPTARNGRPLKYTLITNPDTLQALHEATMKVCRKLNKQAEASDNEKQTANMAMFRRLISTSESGYEVILRKAKAVILIHGEDLNTTADANLAYQNASLMAEALGVAHFYTGYVRLFSIHDTENVIKSSVGIKGHILAGMALGMPKYKFDKYIERDDLDVDRLV